MEGKRLIQLDLTSLVAGTRYRGGFEECLKNVIQEIREHTGELIVFIDEGSTDASNILKPPLARGELHVIGAGPSPCGRTCAGSPTQAGPPSHPPRPPTPPA